MKPIADYESEIINLHYAVINHIPGSHEHTKLTEKLRRKVSNWADVVKIQVLRANNEQLPWLDDELGLSIKSMYTKANSGLSQVGDYIFQVIPATCDGKPILSDIVVERKGGKLGPEDLYGTLMDSDNRARFYREIQRFKDDPRFKQMIIIAECTENHFLGYRPMGNNGATENSRRETLNSIIAKDIHILFAGNRANAIKRYRGIIRHWTRHNYAALLVSCHPYNVIRYANLRSS